MVTRKAYTQATAADSVAVNTPDRIPPMMIAIVPRPHRASTAIPSDSRNDTGRSLAKPRLRAVQSTSPTRDTPKISPGNTPARNRLPIEIVPPAASEEITALCEGGVRGGCAEPLQGAMGGKT